jgi:SAM-dependent methyltransferase
MHADIAAKLIELNREFYQTFGHAFSEKRQRLQPGVRRVLDSLSGLESILDLGCGNGEVARALARRGHRGAYLGLDFSLSLLTEAGRQPAGLTVNFAEADLTSNDWESVVASERFSASEAILSSNARLLRREEHPPRNDMVNIIFCFAVLHHIPSESLRLKVLNKIHALLASDGKFILSNWQFLNSDKWRARIQPWERIGLSAADVDEGDYLLDWRHGGEGLRYVHCYSDDELISLAAQSRFDVQDSFHADGEGGRLSLYQICSAR